MPRPSRQPLLVLPDDSPMFESLYAIGCAYGHSAKLIEEYGDRTGAIAFVFPATVCQAFAVELFLKFFLVLDHPSICGRDDLKPHGISLKKHGHSHSSMWDDVPSNYQAVIATNYKAASGALVNAAQFRQKLLEIDDNPFVKWRYVHEEHDWSFLRQDQIQLVVDALRLAAEQQMKNRR